MQTPHTVNADNCQHYPSAFLTHASPIRKQTMKTTIDNNDYRSCVMKTSKIQKIGGRNMRWLVSCADTVVNIASTFCRLIIVDCKDWIAKGCSCMTRHSPALHKQWLRWCLSIWWVLLPSQQVISPCTECIVRILRGNSWWDWWYMPWVSTMRYSLMFTATSAYAFNDSRLNNTKTIWK